LKQVEAALGSENAREQSLVVMPTLVLNVLRESLKAQALDKEKASK